ncbi:DUF3152 domain-containing protein [Kineosporia succinea]|uniref:DUF3152 domain-containing protein n=1 Tax=Kineosporia succinea TaxID=84632 RepID=A0ABT9PDX5_9ACTN|nr:DUF3152 domain-containing protein [Kineosporia succinea]MDP9830905.1 hypothetical protein [Kineosporia succinea]
MRAPFAVFVATGVLALSACSPAHQRAPVPPAAVAVADAPAPRPTPRPTRAITYEHTGPGTWLTARGRSRVAGSGGPVLRYHVAVERGITGVSAKAFAADVVAILSDDRSWTGAGDVRLQRVGPDRAADFTIRLTTPGTRNELCGSENGYTSCRIGDDVVINVARWAHGAEASTASLKDYRTYMINHETGHRLGHGHDRCPGRGRLAPVMQQQTLGLHGCRPNSWPRAGGHVYDGPAGEYDDVIPTERSGRPAG